MNLWLPIVVLVIAAVAGCGEVDRKWMKLSGNYTTEDLRRDLTACTRDRVLNDRCMEDRGWVVMNPGKEDAKTTRNQDLEREKATKSLRY